MFRKVSISLLIAVSALLVLAAVASAHGRWDGTPPTHVGLGMAQMHGWQQQDVSDTAQPPMLRSNDGACANFVDADGDGVCDHAGTGAAMGPMGSRGMNRGQGTGMGVGMEGQPRHQFGDGICDYGTPPRDGSGNQYGQ